MPSRRCGKQAAGSDAADRIEVLGHVDHSELVPLMLASVLVVAPTRPDFPEGRCMSVMEALILERPVVAPNFGPFPYLVDDDVNGLLFAPGSRDDLARSLSRCLTDESTLRRLSEGAARSGLTLRRPEYSFADAFAALETRRACESGA